MPYTLPTANELQTRYPAFATTADGTIDLAITDAARFVDETWLEDDYQPAIMALAAHNLTMEGALGGSVQNGGAITSEKLGDASTSYGNAIDASKSVSDWGQTTFGRAFLRLLRVNQPGVMVTNYNG